MNIAEFCDGLLLLFDSVMHHWSKSWVSFRHDTAMPSVRGQRSRNSCLAHRRCWMS